MMLRLLCFCIIFVVANASAANAEIHYFEGEKDASNEFLELKEESLGIGSHFKRLKRGLWDFWSTPDPSTEKPYEDEIEYYEDTENELDSGLPDRGDVEIEPREKTLRVTLVVYELFQTEYSKQDSIQFRTFSKYLVDAVNQLYDQLPGTQRASLVRIQNLPFNEFTWKVTLDIVTTGYDNTDRIAAILLEHIQDKRTLGNIAVSDTDFSANLIDLDVAVCAADDFTCGDGACVTGSAYCNGVLECSDGSDEEGCPPTAVCAADEITCGDGACVAGSAYCNGVLDCADGSDEEGCPPTAVCAADEITCGDGACVTGSAYCNGVLDCADRSDEEGCPPTAVCAADEITCGDGACVAGSAYCNGVLDCADRSDEEGCPPTAVCAADEITCDGGACVAGSAYCNGVLDCADGSDEEGCPPTSGSFSFWAQQETETAAKFEPGADGAPGPRPLAPLDEANRLLRETEAQSVGEKRETARGLMMIGDGLKAIAQSLDRIANAMEHQNQRNIWA